MDDLMRAAWDPIFKLYAAFAETPCEPFEERFGVYVVPHHLEAKLLAAAALRQTLQRQSPKTACGPDDWRVAELRSLPDYFLEQLATLLDCVERLGRWPPALCQAWITIRP